MQAFRWYAPALRVGLVACAAAWLAGCSGAVSGTASSTGPIVVSPASAVVYSDLPATFLITGGNGNYLVASSNQAALPIADSTTGHSFTVIPGTVGSDTPVVLTVRDTANSSAGTANITVKPRTISNVVTVTPSASQAASCGTAICAGGDAEVAVYLTQGDVPLAGRTVRFDVVSGDLRIYTTNDALATSGTAVTDNTGRASIRVKALDYANGQTALLDVTDTASGATVRTAVAIAPAAAAALVAEPTTLAFIGPNSVSCANGISAEVLVFGGRPPYTVSQSTAFAVFPTIVTSNPGRITVTSTGQCSDGSQIVILDAAGASATVTATNKVSSVTTSTFDVAPDNVTLTACNQSATVALAGGTGTYFTATGSNLLDTRLAYAPSGAGVVGYITRMSGTNATGITSVSAAFSDGQTTKSVTVKLSGAAAALCP